MAPGRNDPCPCGSGKKYKKCCADTSHSPGSDPRTQQFNSAPTATELNPLIALFNAERYAELENAARALSTRYPNAGITWKILSIALMRQGKNALSAAQKAAQLLPDDAEAYLNLGINLEAAGHLQDAMASYQRALVIKPDFAYAHTNLGNVLRNLGRLDEAIANYQRALQYDQNFASAHCHLGLALYDLKHYQEAATSCRRALELNPDYAEAHHNLGLTLKDLGKLEEAMQHYQRAIEINPQLSLAHSNLGTLYKDIGRLDDAIASFRRALAIDPDNTAIHSNLVYTLYFHPAFDEATILKEAKQFAAAHPAPSRSIPNHHAGHDYSPFRRLRIGYVSPDFRNHCQALFTIPLFSHHDHEQFEIFCYAHLARRDEISERLAGYADTWRETAALNDSQLANVIAADHIDILVDLTMHMSRGRPMVFARKPAPVQIAWLAYPGTTGLPEIDYRLTDPWLDPPELGDDRYTETSVRLPDTFWCYDPLITDLRPNALPVLSNGHVTFGCLNNFCKVSDDTLDRWGQVMARVPGSKLILLSPTGSHRQRVLDQLGRHDINTERIEFVDLQPRHQYLQTYHRIDICLDTLPYNGHTTSIDAYWMGVPVITQVGHTVVGRAGWSQLNNLGLTDLAAFDSQSFVEIAVDLTSDLSRLATLRSTLRQRLKDSPLMDGNRFALAIESAYRKIWQKTCDNLSTRESLRVESEYP